MRIVQRGLDTIQKSLGKLAEKGKFSAEERDAICGRITPSTDLEDLAAADLVIEAVFEKFEVKSDVLARLDAICRAGDDPRQQHLLDLDHQAGRRPPGAPTGSSACTSSTPCRSCN